MTKTEIAELVHEFNRLLQAKHKQPVSPPWSDAPRWMKDSGVDGVSYILRNPGCVESSIHENWRQNRMRDGWKWGPVKDEKKKEHPSLLPFDRLSPEKQRKDRCFLSLVLALSK